MEIHDEILCNPEAAVKKNTLRKGLMTGGDGNRRFPVGICDSDILQKKRRGETCVKKYQDILTPHFFLII